MKDINNNPLYPVLKELFKNLNLLRGLLLILVNRFDNYIKQIINNKVDFSRLLAGSSLVIRKLTELPKNGFSYYPTGRFVVKGQKYLETLKQLIERESAWTISQAYERFESFLFDIYAMFLTNNNKFAKIEEKKKSIRDWKEKLNLNKSQLNNEEWKKVLKKCYRNDDILKNIGEWIPNFKNVMENNNEKINLLSWYYVISEVRHAATHSNLIIKNEKLQKKITITRKKINIRGIFSG